MEYATLRLTNNQSKFFDLKFKLNKNTFTDKWIECVLNAQRKKYPISEPWAIYNLNNDMNPEFIRKNLNRLMKEVDKEQVLFNLELVDINDQKMLNKIHAIFEENHGKLDEWKLNPLFQNKSDSFRKNLSEINQFVHACEVIGGSKKIRIAWFNIPKEKKFTNDDYKLFTNKRNFGSLYHMYCDVGKPLEDLAVDNDDHHHDIVPHLHFSSDCVVHFQTDTDDDVKKMEENIESYKIANKDFLNSKGYFENDPRLTTGRIELGKLETELTQEQILNELKNYNHIQNFILT